MTRTNSTIVILSASLVVLVAACFVAKPLVVNSYDDRPVKFLSSLSHTNTGQKLIKHYLEQIKLWTKYRIGPYGHLNSAEPQELYFALSRMMFAGLAALFVCLVSLVLFVMINWSREPQLLVPQKNFVLVMLLIILNGTFIRLLLAWVCYGNFDMQSFDFIAHILAKGGNVYATTDRYNYSPVWFTILDVLKAIQLQFFAVPFHFVVRSFLCCIDLLTLAFLLLIAGHEKISKINTAILFYLNPVSFLLTGYHGQFENLAVFMVIVGLFAYLKLKYKPVEGKILLWIFATAGMIVKHSIFYELIICLNSAVRRYWVKLFLFAVSVCVFLATFIPYWQSGKEGIIKNVFKYSSHSGYYGIMSLVNVPALKYVFVLGLFVFPFLLRGKDIVRRCLLGQLFFLSFATGIGIQYFSLPIALGALCPSGGFFFYSTLGWLFIIGNDNNLFVPVFGLLGWNVVWIGAVCWFALELFSSEISKQPVVQLPHRRKK